MTKPTALVREATYARDGYACVECGTGAGLSWGHRQASGMGGRGSKAPALTPADGVTQCEPHNEAAEHAGQQRALALGHKVKRNTLVPMWKVPYYENRTGLFWLPDREGGRWPVPDAEARAMIAAANT